MSKKQKKVLIRIIISSVLLVALMITSKLVQLNKWVEFVLFLVPYLIIGYDILKKAIKGIAKGQVFDENFLMAVATIGAVALGDFAEGAAVMLFYQIGELFQSVAVGKSRRNITSLMDIRPDYANVEVDGKLEKVDPDDVEIGTDIIVNPGEKVPIDGVVVSGESTLNTSALTGESVPRSVKSGDEIISGCINLTGVLRIKTSKEFGDSTVSKILDLVENSSMKKSKSENFITKFARYYTPAVCGGALVLAVLPPIVRMIMGESAMWGDWITRALTFLVISCPCALVISIPLSFFAGIGCASANGVLVKGSNYLEALSDTQYIVFDKTGTLTKGVFEVTGIYPANGFDESTIIGLASYAESASNHPISISLKKYFGKEIKRDSVSDIEEIAGHGVSAVVNGHKVYAGNIKLMHKENIAVDAEHNEETVVYVSCDGVYAGCIVISDVVKDNSKKAISNLKKSGIDKTVMLTGDSKETAKRVAENLGLDEYHAELLPADKVEWVEKLLGEKSPKKKLAFVGDGINDAPVLSRADIGIAMGALGSDAAIEAADIVLMDDDPSKIALARKISVHTLKIVKENIWFALIVKAVCLVLGALGIANMWIAIFADVGVMVLAVLNAIRALKLK
ncbi:cadmium-exporting ATPase [Firmicutes bacterium CAG:341]|uniref:heavy metal translocating P-type ATPase n=1 Tax=Eubacterium sp. TaxID=142586 RepID=UPI00033E935B|nr:cadmium-exporting ATPase [Firmicutes bacterium CAG:341]